MSVCRPTEREEEMSDRLWKITATYGPDDAPMMWEEATVDEALAFVRRGVESGEIEGVEHTVSIGDSGVLHVSPVLLLDEAQIYLVIPVGGKDV